MRTALLAAGAVAIAFPAAARDERASVDRVLDGLHAAASKADAGAYWSLFRPDAVFVGTDVAERWTIPQFKAYADPYFSRGKGWTYTVRDRQVTFGPADCRCAWFEETLDSAAYGTTRGTGVLLKGEGGWKIAQYSLSIPVPNDIAKDVTAQIKAFEQNR